MPWKWYGVKTLYRAETTGKADHKGAGFDPQATMVEERVVLFRARSFDEAVRKAEREAQQYVTDSDYTGCFGQRVSTRYMGCADVFWLFEPPAEKVEVFSTTEIFPAQVSDAEIIRDRIGKTETVAIKRKRRNFFNRALAEKYLSEKKRVRQITGK